MCGTPDGNGADARSGGSGVGKGAGKAVELGDNEGVTTVAGGEGFAQSGSVPAASGQAVTDVDPVIVPLISERWRNAD